MRVALVVPEYRHGTGGQGGVATVADYLHNLVIRSGWRVDLYSVRMNSRAVESRRLSTPASWFRRLAVAERRDEVEGYSVGAHVAELEFARYLPRKALDERLEQADVVILVAGTPAFAHVTRRVRGPVILQVATTIELERAHRSSADRNVADRLRAAMTRFVARMDVSGVRLPDVVVTENDYMTSYAHKVGAKRVVFCPPGVDTSKFTPAAGSGAHLIKVARLGDPRKDLTTLVRGYARARELGCQLPLVLAGRGNVPAAVASEIERLCLKDHVRIRSDVSHDDLVRLLQDAAFFISSSTEEGLGIAAIEGMACGLPVVGTATEGTKTVVGSSQAGEVVAIGDAEGLGHAIWRWATDDGLRSEGGKLARKRAVEIFSNEATEARWRSLIEASIESAVS
ncbi:glycosyltransferase family 4 protein [Nocardioides sp. GCM10027113]|uniref:glycosyltransferase family 4 protein n=1 Tax=unclassified Nocardioides TaxID=2615069 RepID=UPI003617D01C